MSKLFGASFTEKDHQMMSFLQRDKLFEKLTERELGHFLPFLHGRNYQKDEVVFFSGDPSQALYMVKNGMVTLNIDVKGNFEKLITLRSGQVFGDNSLIVKAKRIHSAIVTTETADLYIIPQINLIEIMDRHKKIRAKVMTAYAEAHNQYASRLFHVYKNSLGFLDLNEVYVRPE